jgi:diadenosine tetraphosphate (Ap4A) HIT family hydrolase
MGLSEKSPFYPLDSVRVIIEGESCVAFYDGYPLNEGHALVIPFEPIASMYDLDADLQAELWQMVGKVRKILKDKFNPAGFNIGINDGAAAGQTMPHTHIHIIPRYTGDVEDPRGGIRWIIPEKAKYWN